MRTVSECVGPQVGDGGGPKAARARAAAAPKAHARVSEPEAKGSAAKWAHKPAAEEAHGQRPAARRMT